MKFEVCVDIVALLLCLEYNSKIVENKEKKRIIKQKDKTIEEMLKTKKIESPLNSSEKEYGKNADWWIQ